MSSNLTQKIKQRLCDPGQFPPRLTPDGYLETVTEWQTRVIEEFITSGEPCADLTAEVERLKGDKEILIEGNKQLAADRDEWRRRSERENQLLRIADNERQRAEDRTAEILVSPASILKLDASATREAIIKPDSRSNLIQTVRALVNQGEDIKGYWKHTQGMLADAQKERDELKAWKESAIKVQSGLMKANSELASERGELQRELNRLQHINSATRGLRDELAMAALPVLLADGTLYHEAVVCAYDVADIAMRHREQADV